LFRPKGPNPQIGTATQENFDLLVGLGATGLERDVRIAHRMDQKPQSVIFTGAFIYARLVCTTEYTVFVFLTLIIQKRFEIVNELLEVNVARSTSFAKSPVKRLIHLHKNLCKASRDLNALFSLQLLMWFGIYFFLIIWDAHASIHVVLLEKKQWVVFIIGAKNVFRNVFDLCYVVKRCADLCHEVKEFVGCKLFTVVVLGELHQGLVVESGIK
jgi:hypothetical protein